MSQAISDSSVHAPSHPGGARLTLVEVVDHREGRGRAGRGPGQDSGPEVERDLGHGTEPDPDAGADDQRSEDERDLVESGKRTEHDETPVQAGQIAGPP